MEHPVAQQRFRTMCVNWFFLHHPGFLQQLDLEGYKELRCKLANKVLQHPQFKYLVQPALEEFDKSTGNEEDFNKCQDKVFRLLDIINKEEKIEEDFK